MTNCKGLIGLLLGHKLETEYVETTSLGYLNEISGIKILHQLSGNTVVLAQSDKDLELLKGQHIVICKRCGVRYE